MQLIFLYHIQPSNIMDNLNFNTDRDLPPSSNGNMRSVSAPQPPPPPPAGPLPEGRGCRQKFPTWKIKKVPDTLPEGPAPLLPISADPEPEPEPEPQGESSRTYIQIAHNIRLRLVDIVTTSLNSFGIFREYYGKPVRIPDENISLGDMSDFPRNIDEHRGNSRCKKPLAQYLWPYPNISAWRLGNWFWNSGDTKSRESLKTLTREVILASDFIPKDLDGVSWDSIDEKLASAAQGTPFEDEGWISATVNICVPTGIKQTKKKTRKAGNELSPKEC